MANKTCAEKYGTELKGGTVPEAQLNKIAHKLQLDLEKDIVRNVYTNLHSFHAEDKIIKHLKDTKSRSLEVGKEKSAASAVTPESDLFFTPKSSPSELRKPFASSKYKIRDNDVASYYKIASVDDIPADEKLEEKNRSFTADKLLEKELAEQDELLTSFQTILSKKTKPKPNFLSLGASSHSSKKSKPKFNKKFESNFLFIDCNDRKNSLLNWKTNPGDDRLSKRDKYLGVRSLKKNPGLRSQEKVDSSSYLEEPSICSSDMEVSTTADSGLEVSLTCQQETSPRENTMSETSGVDLTEAAVNEDIPNDETVSRKHSSTSSASSEAGTWDATDDFKLKVVDERENQNDGPNGKTHLNQDELNRLDEMEKNIRDCEVFLYMERKASLCEDNYSNSKDHSTTDDDVPGGSAEPFNYETAKEPSTHCGEIGDENHYSCLETNLDDDCNPETKNYDANEFQGVADESVNSVEYFAQPDILRDVQEAKTPPCTPKKLKTNDAESKSTQQEETKAKNWENSSGVSNYFIDASSLLDETEILTPPISLINFKPAQTFEKDETDGKEEPKTVSKKIVTNFYSPYSTEEASVLKENERRQGDFIFRNSIPHYSKHEVEERQSVDSSGRLGEGSDKSVDDESEQVVPSADIEFSPPRGLTNKQSGEKCCSVQSDYFVEPESDHPPDPSDNMEGETRSKSSREPAVEIASSVSSGSPSLRRRNESAPILSGGMDFVEEKTVQRKPSQSQGEAWIVTFDDDRKTKTKEGKTDSGDDSKLHSVHLSQERHKRRGGEEDGKTRAYPVQKSNSSGYFLDLNDSGSETSQPPFEIKTEKKNMFSMFIGMDDNPKSTLTRKSKPIEREGTFDKSLEDSSRDSKSEAPEDKRKPFFMFIESDSPNVKRKIPKKLNRDVESSVKRNLLRTHSYTIDRDPECSSSDNSLPHVESSSKITQRSPLSVNKPREVVQETKFTAWAETKQPGDSTTSESWLRSKDVQVNYRGRNRESEYQNSFSGDGDYQDRHPTRHKVKQTKPPERDSGVVLSDRGDDSFVRLSDLDSSGHIPTVAPTESERLSKSISEKSNGRTLDGDTRLTKSIENDETITKTKALHDRGVSLSLSRLFPNLSAQSLARMGRKDGERGETDLQGSVSEVSSSMQSSVEPSGLEISTSETDVSTHVGPTSKLGEDLLKMFLEEISPDVVIEVNGRRIKAHKCILSSRCQYFAAMLSGGWVESAGDVISLQGFSYNAVHFALRHIYSGESRIPESLSIVELATLADMLCLDGLQEIISYNLKVKYCHSFHVPCSVCSVGVLDCLPIAAAYGLDDLYRKCLRWITKYFVKIWPTKSFGSLPKELLEKCYQHYVVHMTVDNVLDTIVSIDKVRGSLPNVRWAESVSRLVNKLHDTTVKYIAEHFSSVLTSDNFLVLGKEAGWNVSRLEDSLIEAVRYLPPEQACWSHARLHRILTVATGSDPPPEMNWNESFLKLLQLIAELVENNLIKQAPRAAKSKAWRQMEPELRSRIQEAACLVLPDVEHSSGYRRTNYLKRENESPTVPQTAKSRNLELRQIKLAMSQHNTQRNPNTRRPLSLQIDQRPKKNSGFIPLRPSMSTSSVRKTEPRSEGIRKTQSRSYILGNAPEPKKTINPRYSEVKSRYLEPKSPLKSAPEKPSSDANQRRSFRYISSSDSSRNCSPSLRTSNSRSSIPQAKKSEIPRQARSSTVLRSGSATTLHAKRDKSFVSNRSDAPSVKTLNRLTKEENLSSDSLCTDSLASEKDATIRRRPGKENLGERIIENSKSTSNSPVSRRHSSESWSSATSKVSAVRKLIMPKKENESRNPPKKLTGRVPGQSISTSNPCKSNVSTPRTATAKRNQKNQGKTDFVNGNANRRRSEVDAENNKKNLVNAPVQPSAVERSGTFLKDEPTILKKPQVGTEA